MIVSPANSLRRLPPKARLDVEQRDPALVRPRPTFWRKLSRLPASIAVAMIKVYQSTLSPALPIVTLGRCGCRFAPTCSHYAADAIRGHGLVRGVMLAMIRLLKCTPLHPGGFDPVPPSRISSPVCRRADPPSSGAQAGTY